MFHGQLVSIEHAGACVRCRLQQLGATECLEHRKHLAAVSAALVVDACRRERLRSTLSDQMAGGTQRTRERGGEGRSADLVQLEEDDVGGDVWTTAKRHRLARARFAAHVLRRVELPSRAQLAALKWLRQAPLMVHLWVAAGPALALHFGPQPEKASAKAPPPSFHVLIAAGTVVSDECDASRAVRACGALPPSYHANVTGVGFSDISATDG